MAEKILQNVNQDKLNASLRFLDKQNEMALEQLRQSGNDVAKLEKLDELFRDESFIKEIAPTTTAAEAQAVFAAHGLELTEEEVKGISRQFAECIKKLEENDGELTEEDLEKIAGGGAWATIGAGTAVGAAGGAIIGSWALLPGGGTAIGAAAGAAVGFVSGCVRAFFDGIFG